jgi:hypothetical protein
VEARKITIYLVVCCSKSLLHLPYHAFLAAGNSRCRFREHGPAEGAKLGLARDEEYLVRRGYFIEVMGVQKKRVICKSATAYLFWSLKQDLRRLHP